jgi:uncharacterized protein YjbJ (UPF0337 family)
MLRAKGDGMGIMDRAKNAVQTSIEKVEKTTGKALGDENMSTGDQVEALKGHAKHASAKVKKATGKALGDENMSTGDQVEALKDHARHATAKIKESFKKA